jgi:hypothetical protein
VTETLPAIPVLDLRQQGITALDDDWRTRLLRLRDACLGFLPAGTALAGLADPIGRRWLAASGSPYLGDIADLSQQAGVRGVWTLHGAYVFGCAALVDESAAGPRLRRTLDLPFHGLGHLVDTVRQRGDTGEFYNAIWPGFVGVLSALAPGRFGATINQAPLRWRTGSTLLRFVDYALNALSVLPEKGQMPPEHLVDLCPASGRLAVRGWEADDSSGAKPLTSLLAVG